MIVTFFIISLISTLVFLFMGIKNRKKKVVCDGLEINCYVLFSIILGLFSFILFTIVSVATYQTETSYIIDEKIIMYEEENASIEEKIDIAVRGYVDLETSTYGNLKDKDAISLISLFPELKSDVLLQKQLEFYAENTNKIKELKERKIQISKLKWALYFDR